MEFPKVNLPTDTVELPEGQRLEVRGLSRKEALAIQPHYVDEDLNAIDALWLQYGTGATAEQADEWRSNTPAWVVEKVVNRIIELSGLDEDASKKDSEG